MAAKAGRLVSIKVSGVAATLTLEPTTATGNITYQVTDPTKRVWDRAVTIVVKNGGVTVDPLVDPYTINRLSGKVIFTTATARTITVSGQYLPMSTLAEGHDVSIDCIAMNGDETVFGNSDVVRTQLYRDCSGTLGRFLSTDTYLRDAFDAAVPVVIEYSPDSGTTPHLRVWALLNKNAFQGARKTFAEETISFEGAPDADGRSHTWLTI